MSKATTVQEYLAALPEDRRKALEAVRNVINANLDSQYAEGIQYGMIGYFVPHSVFPDGYHCDPREPLPFASIASQKNHMAVYMFCLYNDPQEIARFEAEWRKTGKKLDMGKSCLRFKKLDDVALDVIGDAIKRMPAKKFIDLYTSMRDRQKAGAKRSKSVAGKQAVKQPAPKVAKHAAKQAAGKTAAAKSTKATAGKSSAKQATQKPTSKSVASKRTSKPASKPAAKSTAGKQAAKPAPSRRAAQTVAAPAAKRAAKTTAKKTAKRAAKSTAKKAAKRAAKPAAKKTAKKTAQRAAKTAAKKVVKGTTKQKAQPASKRARKR